MQHAIIVKNTFYQIVTRGITSAVTLVITIVIARELGVIGYGDFTKVTSFIAFFYLLVDFGLNAIFLQYYQQSRFKQLFLIRLLLSSLAFILANLIAFALPYNAQMNVGFSSPVKIGILLFSVTLFSQAVILSASAVFQKNLEYKILLKASCIGSLITLLCVAVAMMFSLSFYILLLSFVVGSVVTAYLSYVWTHENILPFSIEQAFIKKILTESTPLALMLIFNLVYFKIDILLLSVMKPTADVGIYGLSYRFFDFLIALPLFLSNSLYPTLLTAQKTPKEFKSTVLFYVGIALLFSLVIILPFWIMSPLLTIIKSDFEAAVTPFRYLLLSLPFFFATSIIQWALIAKKKQRFLMTVYLLVAVLNIVLNAYFIPYASYNASAIITGVSEGVVFMFLLIKLLTL